DLDLPARSCRFHFEPDRFDEAELARRVSLAIEVATMAVQLEASGFVDGRITSALQEPAITSGGRDELPVTTGSDRCRCMALGGGSLMAGIAGLVLPRGGKGVRNHKRQGILAALGKLGPDSLLPGLADIDKPPAEARPPREITAENAGYLTWPVRTTRAPVGSERQVVKSRRNSWPRPGTGRRAPAREVLPTGLPPCEELDPWLPLLPTGFASTRTPGDDIAREPL